MYDIYKLIHYNYEGEPTGEIIAAHDRTFNFALNQPQTISFTLDATNPMVKVILEEREGSSMIALMRRSSDAAPGAVSELAMMTEIQSLNLVGSGDSKSLAVVSVETMWPRLMARLIRKSLTERVPTFNGDKGLFVHNTLEVLNAAHYTTIDVGSRSASSNMVMKIEDAEFETFGGVVNQLALTTEGFDFWQEPMLPARVEGAGAETTGTGKLTIAKLRGSTRSEAIFEYGEGTRANLAGYNFFHDRTKVANEIYILPPTPKGGLGLAPQTANSKDEAAADAWLYRDALSPAALSDYFLAQQLAEDTVSLRKSPIETFSFEPVMSTSAHAPGGAIAAPIFPRDYGIGDIVTGRVRDYGIEMLDALVRVYGVTIALDNAGSATHTLDLSLNTS